MATITKNFKIKNGLIVEGSTATVNGNDVLTKSAADTTYIQGLVGGVANSEAVANAIVLRDANASFAANVVTADLVGDVTGTVSDISNHDTDSLAEGTTNKYFSNSLARDAFSAGAGIAAITNGVIEVNLSTGLEFRDGTSGGVRIDRDETDTWYDAAGSADTAQTNAQNYTDTEIGALTTDDIPEGDLPPFGQGRLYFTDNRAVTAISNNLGSGLQYVSGQFSVDTSTIATQSYADTAQTNAVTIANAYTDDAVANLVNGAPELLDTLNELAAALDDNPNVIADLQGIAAGKQDALTAGTGIDIVGNTISVTSNTYDAYGSADTAQTNAQNYTDNTLYPNGILGNPAFDLFGAADTAQTNAQNYADGLASNYDAAGSADTAQTNAVTIANSYTDTEIDALTTKDVAEDQDYLYFTDQRAKDAATVLLTQEATLNNITITSDLMNGLVITAENGVADSTTDDLAQGSTNLYFSNSLAVGALTGSDIDPNRVTINTYRKEEARQQYVASASTVTVHDFSAPYESAKYLVRVVGTVAGVKHSQLTEILLTTDGNGNIAITEYGTIYTSENPLASFTAELGMGGNLFRLNGTTSVAGCEIIAAATMLSWAD